MSRRFTGAYAAIARALVAGDAKARLARHGYVVLDDAFDVARARALKDEFNALRRRGAFVANASLFAREGVVALAKPHVYECEVHRLSKEDAASAPLVNELANETAVMEALNEAFGALGGASDGFQSLVSLFEKLLKPVRLVAVCGVARATARARRRRRRRGVAFRAFRTLVGATAGVGRRHARRTRSEGRAKRRAACCACECV